MKRKKFLIIYCLVFVTLLLSMCSITYLYKNKLSNNTIISKNENINFGENKNIIIARNSKKIGRALTADEVEEELKNMEEAPTYEELVKLAKDNYGMSEDIFKMAFGWCINEGYDSARNSSGVVDHYLGYLADCIGINYFMGYNLTTAEQLAAKIGGADTSGYTASHLRNNVQKAINNPKSYAAQYKGMYLALKYPDENAHGCDGLSNYTPLGGTLYYTGGAYGGYTIKVWTLWYTGIKNWKNDYELTEPEGAGVDFNPNDFPLASLPSFTSKHTGIRVKLDNLCANENIKEVVVLIGTFVNIAIYAIPVIIMVLGMVDFGKAVISSDEKALNKATSSLIKRLIGGIAVALIPTLLIGLINTIGITENEAEDYESCVNCLLHPFNDCQTE